MSNVIMCSECKKCDGDRCNYFDNDSDRESTIACILFEPKNPTVFQQITASPEVLARKVVYPVFDYGNSIGVKIRGYKSPFLNDIYPTWNLAFEKTLAKLKEVCDDTK